MQIENKICVDEFGIDFGEIEVIYKSKVLSTAPAMLVFSFEIICGYLLHTNCNVIAKTTNKP